MGSISLPRWVRVLLTLGLGLFLGSCSTCVVMRSNLSPAGSAFLQQFAFPETAARAGSAEWQVVDDQVWRRYHDASLIEEVIRSMLPPEPLTVTRHIIARAKIPPNEQFVFDGKLRNALADELITRYGQENYPVLGNGGQSIKERNGQVVHTYQSSSRRNYVIDGIHGMVLISLIGEEDSITAFIVLTEVP